MSLKHKTVKNSKNIVHSSEESILNQIGINHFNNGEISAWRGLKRHAVNGKAYGNLQNSKSWLYLKSSDFALECSAVGEGSKFFFSLSSRFVSLVSSFLLVGWLILVEFPLNPMHSCSLFVCKTYGLPVFIVTTFRRRVSDFRQKVRSLLPNDTLGKTPVTVTSPGKFSSTQRPHFVDRNNSFTFM